jgi:starch phosphorylase
MKKLREFTVIPSIPERLAHLHDIAYNLWWSWESEAIELWRRMDFDLWDEVNHNPLRMLGNLTQERFKELSEDDSFLAHLERVSKKLDSYLDSTSWYDTQYNERATRRIAYFSFEYGLAESFPIYSGGLGILSGDHLKSASDLGLPLVAVGLLYRRGYFRQYLNTDGWQQEFLPPVDVYTLPIELQVDSQGEPCLVEVQIGTRTVYAQIWKVLVGRIPLYLLDTNHPLNSVEDREITSQLYGGDFDLRIRQEMILGIGGYRALHKLGITPSVCHMNEGHAAFQSLERVRELIAEKHLTFEEARIATTCGNVFTTHTPVPAGNDRFPADRIEHYFNSYIPLLGITKDQFLGLGRENENDPHESFCMTVLALKLSSHSNGVSQLHGTISRAMWKRIWQEASLGEIPIDAVTNGVHIKTWISGDMAALYDRYLGIRWWSNPCDQAAWERVKQIPDGELWRTHERRAERLVSFVRRRLKEQLTRRGLPLSEIRIADEVLDPDCLTIGFARRFAVYKRGTLLFRDPERLAKILNNPERPVQIIFAGKAHPADVPGKEIIRSLAHFCRQAQFRHHVVFLEDYDMNVARYLLQGVDIWLNTPRRPLEASGTSGMKAAANGVLNLSIPDGWWCEGFLGDNGWSIGSGEDYSDQDYQDKVESEIVYDLLEKDIVPLFYERGRDDLPRGWIQKMKRSIMTICPRFNTHRMLLDYAEKFYFPSTEKYLRLSQDNYSVVRSAATWEKRVLGQWSKIRITAVHSDLENQVVPVGGKVPVRVDVDLQQLNPEDLEVEVFFGKLTSEGEIDNGSVRKLEFERMLAAGVGRYSGNLTCHTSGRFAFVPRLLARHPDIPVQDHLKNIIWG